MRSWSSSVVEAMQIRCCAQCPDHRRLTRRSKTASGSWVTENTCAKCRRTGRQIQLLTIDDHCPLPAHHGGSDSDPTDRAPHSAALTGAASHSAALTSKGSHHE